MTAAALPTRTLLMHSLVTAAGELRLSLDTDPLPALADGEVLVAVEAAPINPSDVLTLTGDYGMLPPLPAVGGNEGVGRVAALGAAPDGQPQHLSVGDLVLLPVGAGTWRSHLLADARRLVALPAGADPLQLSMLTVNPATAALLLSEFVALQPGDWVVQNAANSAVGGYLVQLARARGLRTVNVVRRDGAVAARLRSKSTRSESISMAFTPSRLARSTSPRYTA